MEVNIIMIIHSIEIDIIDNFTIDSNDLNVYFSFIIGRNEFKASDIKEFLFMYNEFKLRITFNEVPNVNKLHLLLNLFNFSYESVEYFLVEKPILSFLFHYLF